MKIQAIIDKIDDICKRSLTLLKTEVFLFIFPLVALATIAVVSGTLFSYLCLVIWAVTIIINTDEEK